MFIFSVNIANAVPAYPKPITIVQPDGSTLTIQKHGDEFFNWTTTTSGHTVMQKNGYYYYVTYDEIGKAQFTNQKVSQAKSRSGEKAFISNGAPQNMSAIASIASNNRRIAMFPRVQEIKFPNEGDVRSIVILVDFQDVKFTVPNPQAAFTNLLNEAPYSAKDYFLKSSKNKFIGHFDVVGPYTLSEPMAFYGANNGLGHDSNPDVMADEAVFLADQDVDFSQYDFDKNGTIDNVFIYYAGYNEAEGGPEDSIWPHRWVVGTPRQSYDGMTLYGYACTSEFKSSFGGIMAGIGVFCHEFCHVFGLADHYDTNGGVNGYSPGLGDYDIMTSGGYNNSGNTPPLFNALEMEMVGWAEPKIFNRSDDITLKTIDHLDTYKILTEVPGEYFLIENRQKNDPNNIWDKYIPASGLIITHVDRSANAMELWGLNRPNGDASHECFKFVVAGNAAVSDFGNWEQVPYPYDGNNKFTTTSSPRAVSWAGFNLRHNISNISVDGLEVKFRVTSLIEQYVATGTISDYDGDLVVDADIIFAQIYNNTESIEEIKTRAIIITTTSNNSGKYSVELPTGNYAMTVIKSGYNTHQQNISIGSGANNFDAELIIKGEIPLILLDKYEYMSNVPITLKVINTNITDDIKWFVDGELVTNLTVNFSKGEHTIKVEVIRSEEDKYIVVKQILVK